MPPSPPRPSLNPSTTSPTPITRKSAWPVLSRWRASALTACWAWMRTTSIDTAKEVSPEYGAKQSFPQMILENLKTAGVQQVHKEDKITFTALTPWPGELVCAECHFSES